jgi:uncharacterized protein (DUF736 family)
LRFSAGPVFRIGGGRVAAPGGLAGPAARLAEGTLRHLKSSLYSSARLTPAFLFVPGRRWPLEQICRLNTENPTHPDFRVVTQGVEIGAGWIRRGENSGKDYVSLSLAAPEFGPRKLYANLGRAAGQDDDSVFTVIWNPADEVSPALALPARGSFSRRILCRRSGLV